MNFGDFLGNMASPLGTLAGGLFEYGSNSRDIGAAGDMISQAFAMNPQNAQGPLGGVTFGKDGGQFQFNPQMMQQLQMMGQLGLMGMQGQGLQSQLFNNANLAGSQEYMGAQQQLATPFNPDLDVRDIMAQRLEASRAAAAPQENRNFNRMRDIQQATGAAGHTGGALQTEAFARGQALADHQRIMDAENFGLQTQNQLFGQALQGQQQNISQGQMRLGNMLNLFGLQTGAAGQDMASSQGFFGQQLGAQQYSTDAIIQLLAQDAARRTSQGDIVGAQMGLLGAQQGQNAKAGGGLGSLVSTGLSIAGMFSDARLKQDIELAATIGDINFYNFKWRPCARGVRHDLVGTDFGVIAQELAETHPELVSMDERSGYFIVDYSGLQEVIENG